MVFYSALRIFLEGLGGLGGGFCRLANVLGGSSDGLGGVAGGLKCVEGGCLGTVEKGP